MGRLSRPDGSARYELTAETSVGRAASATLRLGQAHVSLQHASVRWTERGSWELRDLLSKNGTYVSGQRITAGTPVRLELGATIGFGSPADVLVVADISPPRPMLVRADDAGAPPIFLSDTLIGLPSLDDPAVSLFRNESGGWSIESRERLGPIADGDLISFGGEHWRCCLPSAPDETAMVASTGGALLLADLELRLLVSRDEESVELALVDGPREIPLGQKACHYLLLTLARGRLGRDLPLEVRTEDGWLAVSSLLDLLQVSEQHLNVDIFRIRQSLKAAGVLDAVSIVERDPQQRRIRLGTGRVSIARQPSPGASAPQG
jgi:FHA domain-containing protein